MKTPIGKLNILGIEHTICSFNPVEVGLSANALGRWIESQSEILINEKIPDDQKDATVWHETIHAILPAIGESELGQNEDFVEKLSRALFQIADLRIEPAVISSPKVIG